MATYRSVRQLSDVEAAYLAGLIDGEGTIALTRKHAGENRQLMISISNTERPILEYALSIIGAGKITRKCISSSNHQPGLTFALGNRQALDLLRQIQPYLKSHKRARGALVLQNYLALTPRNGKYTDELRRARNAFEEQFIGITTRIRSMVSITGASSSLHSTNR